LLRRRSHVPPSCGTIFTQIRFPMRFGGRKPRARLIGPLRRGRRTPPQRRRSDQWGIFTFVAVWRVAKGPEDLSLVHRPARCRKVPSCSETKRCLLWKAAKHNDLGDPLGNPLGTGPRWEQGIDPFTAMARQTSMGAVGVVLSGAGSARIGGAPALLTMVLRKSPPWAARATARTRSRAWSALARPGRISPTTPLETSPA